MQRTVTVCRREFKTRCMRSANEFIKHQILVQLYRPPIQRYLTRSEHKRIILSLPRCKSGSINRNFMTSRLAFTTANGKQHIVQKSPKESLSGEESFQSILSRFKKLEKDAKADDIDDVTTKSKQLVELFLSLATMPSMKDKMVENINTILNFYDSLDRKCEFDELASKMKSLCIANETTYYLNIRQQMKTGSWVDGLKIVENMKNNGIEIHARTYHHIILNAFRAGDHKHALMAMQNMKTLQKIFHDDFYKVLIDTAIDKQKESKDFIFASLDLLKDTGFTLGPKSFGTLKRWFESDRRTWKVGTSLVNLRGICKCCGNELQKFSLPEKQRIALQEKLTSIAETAILNATNSGNGSQVPLFASNYKNDPIMKIQALKHFIDINGPFDIALDVLNAAYFKDRGFNSFQVKRVVRHFNRMGKRVLALCSSPLLSSLLEDDAAPDLPNHHMIQLLHYLRRHQCGIFFVDDTKKDGHIDDHFILLSMAYHNMDIDIVTADKFGDHVHSLDTFTLRDFHRWMKSHQIVLKKFTENGQPIFYRRENFDTDVQSTEISWHIPGPNRQWLCCTRR